MGQRLVITIHAFDKDIAKVYYHWSGYTYSAYAEAYEIIFKGNLSEAKDENELIDRLLNLLEETHGGVLDGKFGDEWREVSVKLQRDNFNPTPNRNYGLLAITPQGMSRLDDWAGETLTINFDDGYVYNHAMEVFDNIEQFNDYVSEIGSAPINLFDIPEVDYDPRCVDFKEIEDVKDDMYNRCDFVRHKTNIYGIIY